MEMENEVTISFSMDAFTLDDKRRTHIQLSHGEIDGDEYVLRVRQFREGKEQIYDFSDLAETSFHAGADLNLVADFVEALRCGNYHINTAIEQSVESHRICYEAERSRLANQIIILR